MSVGRDLLRPGVLPAAAHAAALIGAAVDLRRFRLAGGTALAWHLGHRVSEDLDFFAFEPGALTGSGMLRLTGQLAQLAAIGSTDNRSDRTVHARVGECKISFFEVAGVWQDEPAHVAEGFDVASALDIGAMKLVAVMTRCAKKDFFDLAALDRAGFALPSLLQHARGMYPGFRQAEVHLRRSLVYFDEAEADPDPITLDGSTWIAVKRRVVTMAASLGPNIPPPSQTEKT